MEATQVLSMNELYSAMNGGKPYQSYKKTIMGQALVKVWDNFTQSPLEIIVRGDPRRDLESCIIDVWSDKEKVFFERMNKRQFDAGVIIPYTRVEVTEPEAKKIEQYSDEELKVIVNSKYLALSATLNKVESVAVLFRLRSIAEEEEKSDKIIKAIEARISELQTAEFPVATKSEE